MGPPCIDKDDCIEGYVCYNATVVFTNITHPDYVANFDTTYK